ncbi:MAG: DUF4131 domain-containing protein, partial [Desulfobacteraceae bacterium]|nr:DUF4131 domain-containing protein [Desulfobacteraceae bacterium]
MTARPFFWLTVCFTLGIAAGRLLAPSPGNSFLFAAIALMLLASLLAPSRICRHSLFCSIAAIAFFVFGMWAARGAAPDPQQFRSIEPFLDRHAVFIAEVSAPPDYYPEKTRIPLRLISALEEDKRVMLDGGVLLTISRKSGGAPSAFLLPGDRLLLRTTL